MVRGLLVVMGVAGPAAVRGAVRDPVEVHHVALVRSETQERHAPARRTALAICLSTTTARRGFSVVMDLFVVLRVAGLAAARAVQGFQAAVSRVASATSKTKERRAPAP